MSTSQPSADAAATPPETKGPATKRQCRPRARLVKALVVLLALVLFGWMLWQASFVRELAVTWVGKAGAPAVPMLARALQDEDPQVRDAARTALLKIGADAVPTLIQRLSHADSDVKVAAAHALGIL